MYLQLTSPGASGLPTLPVELYYSFQRILRLFCDSSAPSACICGFKTIFIISSYIMGYTVGLGKNRVIGNSWDSIVSV